MEEYDTFRNRFNASKTPKLATTVEIEKSESQLNIKLPVDFKLFLLEYGNMWTPSILDIIVDKKSDLLSLQKFWTLEEIEYDKKNEWTSSLEEDLIPFASDSMGNIFAFKADEIRESEYSSPVYFFDHDMETIEFTSNSFIELIEDYNNL